MSAEQTPRALRRIITLTGCRNAGKSALINALTGQETAIVSPVAGTTTDAVAKAYELLPLGPVTFYDTAGLDDDSPLGAQRIQASRRILFKTDVAVLVIGDSGLTGFDKQVIADVKKMNIPLVAAFNKCDQTSVTSADEAFCAEQGLPFVSVSARDHINIDRLKELIIAAVPEEDLAQAPLLDGLIAPKDTVVLVAPVDASAPKGRLILPQVQILREILDFHAAAAVVQPEELAGVLSAMSVTPKLVITDSQAVLPVHRIVPPAIALTTFSILFARAKGDLKIMAQGAAVIDRLKDDSRILIAEACSHHAQDDDIAKVKIPSLLRKYTGKKLEFSFAAGCDFPDDLEQYDLIIHCGACMLNRAEMRRRLKECLRRGVPVTNYGVAISKTQGILERVIKPFGL